MNIKKLAEDLYYAEKNVSPIKQLSANQDLGLVDAYRIQDQLIELRCAHGEKVIGLKLGFTSKAKMQQMGVSEMIYSWLTDAMQIKIGGKLELSDLIKPRAEPEICVRTKKDIHEPISAEQVADYLDGVAAAIEIIDSRYKDFSFALADVVADNSSASHMVIGEWSNQFDTLDHLPVTLSIDEKPVARGSTQAIMGHPFNAVAEASKLLARAGKTLPAGSLIMAGAATQAENLHPGMQVAAHVEQLGGCYFRCQ